MNKNEKGKTPGSLTGQMVSDLPTVQTAKASGVLNVQTTNASEVFISPGNAAVTATQAGTTPARVEKEEPFHLSMKLLKNQLLTHQGDFKLLLQKADELQIVSEKSRSNDVKAAIGGLIKVVVGLKLSQDKVAKAFNTSMRLFMAEEGKKSLPSCNTKEKQTVPSTASRDAQGHRSQ